MHLQRRVGGIIAIVLLSPVLAAYIQWLILGLPDIPKPGPYTDLVPRGFPWWLRVTHSVNLLLMVILIRSGLQILMDHPRLYWNVHCTPDTEWLRLTPIKVPTDRVWTAKDDARYLTPWIGLPGGRHTVGMARHWHFIIILFWVSCGLIYVILLFGTGQWRRLVPQSWSIIPEAWQYFVYYATFHLPPEPDTFYQYNPLQQLAYFSAVFILAPLSMITGPSMSPAFTNRFWWYPRLPGNRQIGRSIHFFAMLAFVGFLIAHVTMVVVTGLVGNLSYIVLGIDHASWRGVVWAGVGLAVIGAMNVLANWLAWKKPRLVQRIAKRIVSPVMKALLDKAAPKAEFRREDISPYFWCNGKVPTSEEWEQLAAGGFRDYRLRIGGLVENPIELSLEDLASMERTEQVTLHHCIQGWSGIAAWEGVPLSTILDLVQPRPEARMVVFHSFGEGEEGGLYYDSLPLDDARHPQTILADAMNDEPLGRLHGAPVRLRIESKLGFKMVKWIERIDLVESIATIGFGQGGYNEDHEYYGEVVNI